VNWDKFFDNWGLKTVTPTDKSKRAYVPNGRQREAFNAAGFQPAPGGTEEQLLTLNVLMDPRVDVVTANYYLSIRAEDAQRQPEPRMGRHLISEWLHEGDRLLIGNIGTRLYALKAGTVADDCSSAEKIAGALPSDFILARARAASGPAPRRESTGYEFVRNPFVVAGALLRADGCCEVPGCTRPLFVRDNGKPFLEVHHLVSLAEGGVDELPNVAALCPSCHREMHHGCNRAALTAGVQSSLAQIRMAEGAQ
jgi:hypothetical protein